jgi:anti-sigma B factor antagonist
MLLRVDCSSEADTARIAADGEIDLATVNKLRSAVTEVIQKGVRHLTVDLDKVSYIDSSGLGMLIGAHKRMTSTGGTLTILCSQARVLRLLSITGLDRVLRVTGHAGDYEPDLDDPVEATPA